MLTTGKFIFGSNPGFGEARQMPALTLSSTIKLYFRAYHPNVPAHHHGKPQNFSPRSGVKWVQVPPTDISEKKSPFQEDQEVPSAPWRAWSHQRKGQMGSMPTFPLEAHSPGETVLCLFWSKACGTLQTSSCSAMYW